MDPASPRVALASCHSPSIGQLKIIPRQQREGDECLSLHGFASQHFFILAAGAGWADVAVLSFQGPRGVGCLSPATPQLGLEKLHQGARSSLLSSHLLSWQWETAHSDGPGPATDSPNGLGHIPAPPQARGPLGLHRQAGSPASSAPAAFIVSFVSFLAFYQGSGSSWRTATPRSRLRVSTCSPGARLTPAHVPASSPPQLR